jgi:hypothetical protein
MSKLITPSIETEPILFTFAGVNNPDGSVKLFTAQTQVEALKQLEEYQKSLLSIQNNNN